MRFLGRGAEGRRRCPEPCTALPCSKGCGKYFRNSQGRGAHEKTCKADWKTRTQRARGARHPATTKPLPFHSTRASLAAAPTPPLPLPACFFPTAASGKRKKACSRSLPQNPSVTTRRAKTSSCRASQQPAMQSESSCRSVCGEGVFERGAARCPRGATNGVDPTGACASFEGAAPIQTRRPS